MFATYPIKNPQHGGQKRVDAFYQAYKKSFNVRFCAIFNPLNYKYYSKYDIKIPRKYDRIIANNPLTSDVVMGDLVYSDIKLRKQVMKQIKSFMPDIIEFEQPFLYAGIEKILIEINYKGKIVFNSQNVEYTMKEEMLLSEGFSSDKAKKYHDLILEVEKRLVKAADLIFAVSREDAVIIKNIGGEDKKIIIAQNAMNKPVDINKGEYWNRYFKSKNINKVALFIGSAHPPNWIGFETMIGCAVGFLKRNESIVLAGSIGDYFRDNYHKNDIASVALWKRVINAGRMSEERLQQLIIRADCILLPITEGGGSNLKTAEALLSKKPIVGTSYAFRAFEKFSNYPNVYISDNPKQFRNYVKYALNTPAKKYTIDQKNKLNEVTWDSCLEEALGEIGKL